MMEGKVFNYEYISNEWSYIQFNLKKRNLTIDDLKWIFDVTNTTIAKWKKGASLSKDKKVFLANMFGVTLEEFINNDWSDKTWRDGYFFINDIYDAKKKTNDYSFLWKMLEFDDCVRDYIIYIFTGEHSSEAYYPFTDEEFVEYSKRMKYTYMYEIMEDGINIQKKSDEPHFLTIEELSIIKKELIESWGDKDCIHHFHPYSYDYYKIVFLTETFDWIVMYLDNEKNYVPNIKYQQRFDEKEFFNLYDDIRKNDETFDKNQKILNALAGLGFTFWKDDIPDYERTYRYVSSRKYDMVFAEVYPDDYSL